MMTVLLDLFLFAGALVGMEGVAWAAHKYLMHGPMWGLHRSHHRPRRGVFEANDLFAVIFAAPSIALIWVGTYRWPPALWIGLGIAGYGLVYAVFHDGIVHRRYPLPAPRGWFTRQIQAHRLHHAVATKHGAVSFGFLWAGDPRALKQRLRSAREDG